MLIAGAVGIARHIQPEPAPSFSVMWRGKQPLDQLFICLWRRVINEIIHFPRTGQKSGQVQVRSPDQRVAIRLRRGLEAFLIKRILDESVYGIRLPPRVSHFWNRMRRRFPERPPLALLDR